uniref:Inner membrane protein n=1 Tax=Candidatus Kentrum sp. TUN TaxID=2126343 RepID=A0A450ZSH4_9GAMM|nr:MAG: inner membrane protein [Candidatus Kentron sp. TUN]
MVDYVSHSLFGCLAGQSIAGREVRRRAALVAALSAFAPDLDMLAGFFLDPMPTLLVHRHFTHSLLLALVIGLVIAGLVMLLDHRLKFKHWKITCAAGVLGAATHGFLDVCTSYGTMWLWPFSYDRLALDIISVFDLFLFSFMLVAVFLSLTVFKERRYFPGVILLVCVAYLFLGVFQNHRTMAAQLAIADARGHVTEKGRVIPNLFGLSEWRSLYISDDVIYADYIKTPFGGGSCYWSGTRQEYYSFDDFNREVESSSDVLEDFKAFDWFSDGFLFKISDSPLTVGDMRFILDYTSLQTPYAVRVTPQEEQLELMEMEMDSNLLLTYLFGPPEKEISSCKKVL